jgi:TonB family protein
MWPLLLDVSLKASVLFGAAWLCSILLRRASAAARHAAWTAVAGAVLLLPLLSAFLPAWEVAVPANVWPSIVFHARVGAASSAADYPAPSELPADRRPGARTPAGVPRFEKLRSSEMVLLIWAIGVARGLLHLVAGSALMWRRIRRSTADQELTALARDLAGHSVACSRVRVGIAACAMMPVAFGFRRPAILLPPESRAWPEDRLRMVLLHELAHIRRYDCLTQVLMRLAGAFYWFHPLAWIAGRQFLRERERACDDLVLARGARASDYARHLLEVAFSLPSTRGTAWAAVAMARPSQLEGRLIAILDPHASRDSVGRLGKTVAAALAFACAWPLAAVRAQAEASSPSAEVASDARIKAYIQQGDFGSLEKIASTLSREHKVGEAERLYLQALALREARFGSQSPEYADGLVKLAVFYPNSRLGRDARSCWQRALAIREAALGPEDPELVEPLYHLALDAHGNRRFAEAESRYQRALAVRAKALGAASPELAPILTTMALLREQQGQSVEAEQMYTRALSTAAADSPERATALELYARLLREINHDTEAELVESQASQIRVRRFAGAAKPVPQEVHRVGGAVSAPRLLSKVEPDYTELGRLARHQGTAVLRVEIGLDGKAHNIRLVRGVGLGLDEKAAEAIGQWLFRPSAKGDTLVVVAATIEVNFRLM